MRFDPAAIPAALANRVLEHEAWARTCLAAHAGQVFAVVVGPLAASMRIDASGAMASPVPSGDPPDLTLTISPLAVPTLLADPTRWNDVVTVDGNPLLAATLKGLAETLPWFVERALAGVLGPIVGQRIADAGRRLLALPGYAGVRVGASVESYARDEAAFGARAAETRAFGEQIAATAANVDALAARIDALAARTAAAPAGIAGGQAGTRK